ncbi:MAG: hypothetical protein WAX89_02050 [Alphaproteobacteria bacterium]
MHNLLFLFSLALNPFIVGTFVAYTRHTQGNLYIAGVVLLLGVLVTLLEAIYEAEDYEQGRVSVREKIKFWLTREPPNYRFIAQLLNLTIKQYFILLFIISYALILWLTYWITNTFML